VSLSPVDGEDDDGDEDDGEAHEDGDQEVHVQVERDHGLHELGVATCGAEVDMVIRDLIMFHLHNPADEEMSYGATHKKGLTLISGLPDFSWRNLPRRGKICIPIDHKILLNVYKIYPMAVKYSKWP
jgi:hypothetical protein